MADNPAGVRAGKAGGPHGLRVLSPADPGYVEWCRSGMPQRIRLLKLAAEKRRRIEQGVICPKCHRRRVRAGDTCLCSISCCGFSHDDFSGLGRACRPRNGLNWMVLVSPPERTGKDYDQHAPSTVYPSFAAERGIRRVDRAENTCQRADGA